MCRSMSTLTPVSEFLVPLPPTCISVSPTGDKPWYLCRGKFAATTSKPSTWSIQRGALLQCHHSLVLVLLFHHPLHLPASFLSSAKALFKILLIDNPTIFHDD